MKTSATRRGMAGGMRKSPTHACDFQFSGSLAVRTPYLDIAEREFDAVLNAIEEPILHGMDRPEIELRILQMFGRRGAPTMEGVAAQMGIGVAAATYHLESLRKAKRVWSQVGFANQMTWHISLEGKHYLEEHGGAL